MIRGIYTTRTETARINWRGSDNTPARYRIRIQIRTAALRTRQRNRDTGGLRKLYTIWSAYIVDLQLKHLDTSVRFSKLQHHGVNAVSRVCRNPHLRHIKLIWGSTPRQKTAIPLYGFKCTWSSCYCYRATNNRHNYCSSSVLGPKTKEIVVRGWWLDFTH